MRNKLLIVFISFMFLFSFVSVNAETKDINAKYEYQRSDTAFDIPLNGNHLLSLDGVDLSISNESSDYGVKMVIIDASDVDVIGNYTNGSQDYAAYYVDFYGSNNKRTTLTNPITISSIRGSNYGNATISVISPSGNLLLQKIIESDTFSFEVNQKSYILINNDTLRKGDINRDGLININDLIQLRKHLAGIKLISENNLVLADINSDGKININDLVKLRKYLAGIEVW